jgi:Planctomycete cytochrome C.
MKVRLFACILFLVIIGVFVVSCFNGNDAGEERVPKTVSYNFHIRPILSDKCFKCHGPDGSHRQAGLRLDLPDSAYAPLKETKGAFAIVPGKPH